MKKKMNICNCILAIFLLGKVLPSSAQQDMHPVLTVRYTMTMIIDTTQRDNPLNRQYVLLQAKGMSKYDDYFNVMEEDGRPVITTYTDESGRTRKSISGGYGGDVFYKDGGKMITRTYLGGNYYLIEEGLPRIDWSMSTEQKQINGYICQKATGRFKGRNYTVWFSPQLPYRNGPWKLGGLPGLILEALDDSNEVHFLATEISTHSEFKTIEVPNKTPVISSDKFKKIQIALQKDKDALAGATVVKQDGSMVTATTVTLTGNGKNRPQLQFNNPLEKQ